MSRRCSFAMIAASLLLASCGSSEPEETIAKPVAASAATVSGAIYADALASGWADWSWASHNLANASPVAQGTRSIAVAFGPWTGLYFHTNGASTNGFAFLDLMVDGGATANAAVNAFATVRGVHGPGVAIGRFCTGGAIPSSSWTRCRVPLSSLGAANTVVDGIILQEGAGRSLPTMYFDSLGFTTDAPPPVAVAVSPKTASVTAGSSQAFTAQVTGTTNSAVTWAVTEGGAGGTVSTAGVYTAPSSAGTFHVSATSAADPTKSDSATVTVTAPPPPPPPPPAANGWLAVAGNHIVGADGRPWHGRGANLPDTRGCSACVFNQPSVAEVERRIDLLVDGWKANFIRLDLESYGSPAAGQVQWQGALGDPAYVSDIRTIVSYATAKPGVYVLLSLWVDPSFTSMGWPTSATNQAWAKWADVFKNEPKVLFGLVNEPQSNFDGAFDAQVWTAMNNAVAAIRAVEDAAGTPHHVITAQGTGGWARRLDYYVTHRIPSDNVAYEVHVYDPQANFPALFQNPSKTLPVVIGEYGPVAGAMTAADVAALMASATSLEIPHLAWTFHMRCSPNLLVDNSGGSCGVGMPLAPTAFGSQLIDHLAQPW